MKLNDREFNDQPLVVYADANWAEDRTSRKSNTGFLFKLFGGIISWASKKQTCVSVSSREAEIVALSEAARKCTWLQESLVFLDEEQNEPTTIYEDNQPCITSVQSTSPTSRSNHIDTQYFHSRGLEAKGIIKIIYCPSESNLADILTKALGPQKTKSLVKMI